MYLTAHRVISSTGDIGINVFLHQNKNIKQERVDTVEAIALVADADPGEIIARECDVKPGGNRVLSFIDVIFPDSVQFKDLQTILNEAIRKIIENPLPVSIVVDGVGIRFGANFGLYDALPKECRDLVHRALSLLKTNFPIVNE